MRECSVCGEGDLVKIYDDLLIECSACGFVTANMDVDFNSLLSVYSDNYFKGEEYEDYLRDKKVIQDNFKKRIRKIEKVIPKDKLQHILEIGCAYGFFGELAVKSWNSEYTGIDIAQEATEHARTQLKLNVACGDFIQTFHQNPEYRSVFMWDVIEHLPHPVEVIEKISAGITPGGYIVITTGDIGSRLARLQGRGWRMIHPPTHLHYFNKQSITRLLSDKGFEVTDISYPAVSRSIKQIFFSLFLLKRERESKFLKKIYNLIPEKFYVAVNTFDIMMIIAKKSS